MWLVGGGGGDAAAAGRVAAVVVRLEVEVIIVILKILLVTGEKLTYGPRDAFGISWAFYVVRCLSS
jgi:hypothetical protein